VDGANKALYLSATSFSFSDGDNFPNLTPHPLINVESENLDAKKS